MKDDKFEEFMENVGDTIEIGIENVADKFDKTINKAWNYRYVRFIAKTLILLLGVILIMIAIPLYEDGQNINSSICFLSGMLIVVANIAEFMIFKRK